MKVWIAVLLSVAALAQEPPNKPLLRIAAGTHTARITDADVDAQERFVVTASQDKTARVWELSTGRLLRVLRVAISGGNAGFLTSVAISPDGSVVASAGIGGLPWETAPSIYLFDRVSGKMIRRLSGHPAVVTHLTFSGDGRFLAAAMGESGIRIYRTADYSIAGEDRDYTASVPQASFHGGTSVELHLATVCDDGYVRLYGVSSTGSLTLLAKRKPHGGDSPTEVQFSPDGSRVAVALRRGTSISVLSTRDLRALSSPNTRGLSGHLGSVGWSPDGTLLAGGVDTVHLKSAVISWERVGQGNHRIWPVSNNAVVRVIPLRNGGLVYATLDPSWGMLDGNGHKTVDVAPSVADFRGGVLGLSPDAASVRAGFQVLGASPHAFSVTRRRLTDSPGGQPGFLPPTLAGLRLTGWEDSFDTKLNGKRLPLAQLEKSRSAAATPVAERFVLGTSTGLRCFDFQGVPQWQVAGSGQASAVNISANGKIAVAALSDGTIRWYRIKDGTEILSLFPHADRKRWVLWTPSGYYDASPGGEDLLGWHVNNGRDAAADFFPASRFRSVYYRPDVVSRVLSTLDEREALRLADAERGIRARQESIAQILPPTIRILSPDDGATFSTPQITIVYDAHSASGAAITGVRVLVNGRPVEAARRLERIGGQQVQVTLPQANSEVSLIAENRFAASVPATIRLRWAPSPAPGGAQPAVPRPGTVTVQPFVIQPKLYLLAVGIGAYPAPNQLRYPAKDARDFVAAFSAQKGLLYRDVQSRVLIDNQATRDAIADGLAWLERSTTQHDVAIVYFAGHGVNDGNGVYYFLPRNFEIERLKSTAVAQSDIQNTVKALAGKVLFFVDSCHAGNAMGSGSRGVSGDLDAVANELASAENGAVVFTASTGRQDALERADWGNGAFTKAVVEGLNGKADSRNTGRITVNMLDLYISERVKELTGGRQTPTTTKPTTIPDFPVAVRR